MTRAGLRALGTSLLRTFVSWVWGLFIGWLLLVVPIFEPFREDLLALSELALPTLILVIAAAWYAGWRWLEPRLPDWLTRALLGSSKQPVYVASSVDVVAATEALDRIPGPDHRA